MSTGDVAFLPEEAQVFVPLRASASMVPACLETASHLTVSALLTYTLPWICVRGLGLQSNSIQNLPIVVVCDVTMLKVNYLR